MKECRGIISLFFRVPVLALFLAMSNASFAEVTDISQAALMQRIKSDRAQLILDVRSPEEYKAGHIPGANKKTPYKKGGGRRAVRAPNTKKKKGGV